MCLNLIKWIVLYGMVQLIENDFVTFMKKVLEFMKEMNFWIEWIEWFEWIDWIKCIEWIKWNGYCWIDWTMYSIELNNCIEWMESMESMVYGVGRDQICAWNIWYGVGPCHWCEDTTDRRRAWLYDLNAMDNYVVKGISWYYRDFAMTEVGEWDLGCDCKNQHYGFEIGDND